MITTTTKNTFAGFWNETKENTWYGYRINNTYVWYKTKKSAIRNMPDKHGWILKATWIRDNMYINHKYAKMGGF